MYKTVHASTQAEIDALEPDGALVSLKVTPSERLDLRLSDYVDNYSTAMRFDYIAEVVVSSDTDPAYIEDFREQTDTAGVAFRLEEPCSR